MYAIAVLDDNENTNIVGIAVLDDQTIIDNMNDISFDLLDEGFLTTEIDPWEEMVLLRTEDERYFQIYNFVLSTWSVNFEVLELDESGRVIPEPSTLLLLGLGLLGLMGIRRWKRKGKRLLKILLLLAFAGGLLLSGAEPVAAQAFDCSTVTQIPQTECEALVALHESTDGANWNYGGMGPTSVRWLTTNTPCNWWGVGCTAGHVSYLSIAGNQGSGVIPPEIGNLTELTTLWLDNNQLTGPIPPELGNLVNLEHLHLQNCQLSGEIPPELGNLGNLEYLTLHHNQLSGEIPGQLGNLGNLYNLWLNDNQLEGEIPPELGSLSQLQHFGLQYNKLSGNIPPELGDLPLTVEYFHLENNQLEGPIPDLSGLTGLLDLYLHNNKLTGNLPSGLGNLTSLETFSVANNQLSGPLPDDLKELSELYMFYFGGTNLCEPQDTEFQTWLTRISNWQGSGKKCSLTVTDLPQPEADALVALYNSTDGDNWTNTINSINPWLATGTSPCDWYGVTCDEGKEHVIELDLNENGLNGVIATEIGNLTELQILVLNNNQLRGSLPANLTHTAVTTLNISATDLCEPQDAAFRTWLTRPGLTYTDSGKDCTSHFFADAPEDGVDVEDVVDVNKDEENPADDDLCWAAAAANMLEWAGWGTDTYTTAEQIFENFGENWENKEGLTKDAWKWWFDCSGPENIDESFSENWTQLKEGAEGGKPLAECRL